MTKHPKETPKFQNWKRSKIVEQHNKLH